MTPQVSPLTSTPRGPDASRAPRWAIAASWLLGVYWTLLGALSCPYVDTVRDINAALNIADGSDWPLTGPILANSIHAGPIWFYLLAPVAAASHSWLGVALFMSALAGLKFPLA
jgi:hypothetical protein